MIRDRWLSIRTASDPAVRSDFHSPIFPLEIMLMPTFQGWRNCSDLIGLLLMSLTAMTLAVVLDELVTASMVDRIELSQPPGPRGGRRMGVGCRCHESLQVSSTKGTPGALSLSRLSRYR